MKKFNIGVVKMEMEANGRPKGFILKRDLTIKESKFIMGNLLGIDVLTKEDFEYAEEYKKYNEELKNTVQEWLSGDAEDSAIMEYVYYCMVESIGIMNLVPIIYYLKKKGIID